MNQKDKKDLQKITNLHNLDEPKPSHQSDTSIAFALGNILDACEDLLEV